MPRTKKNNKGSRKKNSSPAKKAKKGGDLFRVYVAYITTPDEDELTEFIGDSGTPLAIRWLNHRNSGRFKGCGFVDFATKAEANAVVKKSQKPYQGKKILIRHASASPKPGITGRTQIYLANVASDNEDKLKKFIGDCSKVKNINFLTDDDGDFKNCGFVEFANPEHADKFMKKNGKKFAGEEVKMYYANRNKPTAFVLGFNENTMDDDKLKKFAGGGEDITHIKWMNDNTYAFVTFNSICAMNAFIGRKNDKMYKGNNIRASVARRAQRKQ